VAERGTVVTVYGLGDIVPVEYQDLKIKQTNGELSEQVIYFGCYWIFARGERPALSPTQVGNIFRELQKGVSEDVLPKPTFSVVFS
jgi:hypothetical protein